MTTVKVSRSLLRKVIAHFADSIHEFRETETAPDGSIEMEAQEVIEGEGWLVAELRQALASEQPADGDVGREHWERDLEETLKYSERDRADFEERAIERFKFREGGFEIGTHPENHPEGIPDEWHEKPFARIHYDGEAADWDAGLSGWEGFCLSPDQS